MTARRVGVAVVILLLAGGFGTGDDKKDKKDEKDKLQGEWAMISLDTPAKKLDDDAIKKSKLVVKDKEWITTLNGTEVKFTFKSDPSKDPKELDLISDRSGKEMTWPGIYKIDGDTLTFCRASGPDAERPKEFKAGDKVVLIVYKRAAK